jgi:hypothetical protein
MLTPRARCRSIIQPQIRGVWRGPFRLRLIITPQPLGGKLYSFGAGTGQTFAYDPNNNSWAARASSHYVHRGTAGVGVINGKIYVAGGEGTPSQRELEVYDPAASTWTVKAPSTDALEVYNPQTNTWSTLASMPTPRSGFAAAVVNNELWVFGGEDPQTLVLHAEVEVYNPTSNSWRREPNMPSPRHGIWASVIGNKIYIPGGGTTPALINPTNTNQIFTVSATAAAAARATVADFNNDGHTDYVRFAGERVCETIGNGARAFKGHAGSQRYDSAKRGDLRTEIKVWRAEEFSNSFSDCCTVTVWRNRISCRAVGL